MEQNAGFWIRLGSMLLDGVIVGIATAVFLGITLGDGDAKENVTKLISFLYSLTLPIFWNGCTIGKRICGIRIRKIVDLSPPSIGTMLLRNVVAGIVYGLTFGIGVIVSVFMVALREDKRALHDFIAGTEVVRSFE
ncbi:putative RDD family membrane protein YckC [Paenibacillus sp. DS2015]|uniref:RDD family protein n=1 Tax=Paenibacillus sp. DS2015 TaxID=3373917 RepID=UPI003D255C95